jgi:hypothetical protein
VIYIYIYSVEILVSDLNNSVAIVAVSLSCYSSYYTMVFPLKIMLPWAHTTPPPPSHNSERSGLIF